MSDDHILYILIYPNNVLAVEYVSLTCDSILFVVIMS